MQQKNDLKKKSKNKRSPIKIEEKNNLYPSSKRQFSKSLEKFQSIGKAIF